MCPLPSNNPRDPFLLMTEPLLLILIYSGAGIFPSTQRYLLNAWGLGSSYGSASLLGHGHMAYPPRHRFPRL